MRKRIVHINEIIINDELIYSKRRKKYSITNCRCTDWVHSFVETIFGHLKMQFVLKRLNFVLYKNLYWKAETHLKKCSSTAPKFVAATVIRYFFAWTQWTPLKNKEEHEHKYDKKWSSLIWLINFRNRQVDPPPPSIWFSGKIFRGSEGAIFIFSLRFFRELFFIDIFCFLK